MGEDLDGGESHPGNFCRNFEQLIENAPEAISIIDQD
jgi:hypothetical protein